jgi:hypothetical protein
MEEAMRFGPIYNAFKNRLLAVMRTRAIKALMFSGSPVIERIRLDRDDEGPVWSLIYKNGLVLTLGESGILDYQDRRFGDFMGPVSEAPNDREFLALLHKIVLKSLLRYITARGVEMGQRERAAEAASKLWLASAHPAGARASAAGNASWSPGSPRESARSF